MSNLNQEYIKSLKESGFITEVITRDDNPQAYITNVGISTTFNNPTGRLVFADPEMERACMDAFGYEEVGGQKIFTYELARSVTEIPAGFLYENKVGDNYYGAKYFDEFKYFTNCTTINCGAFVVSALRSIVIPRSVVNIKKYEGENDSVPSIRGAVPTITGNAGMVSLKVDKANPKYTDAGADCIIEKGTMRLITATNNTLKKFPSVKTIGFCSLAMLGFNMVKEQGSHDAYGKYKYQWEYEHNTDSVLILPSSVEAIEYEGIISSYFNMIDMSNCRKLSGLSIITDDESNMFSDVQFKHIKFYGIKYFKGEYADRGDSDITPAIQSLSFTETIEIDNDQPVQIGSAAFYNSDGDPATLRTVILRCEVSSIDAAAFGNQHNLTRVECYSKVPPDIDDTAFATTNENISIYVPKNLLNVYKEKFAPYAERIKPL